MFFSRVSVLNTLPVGQGPIKVDDLLCNGTESSLDECLSQPKNESVCSHIDDVGVECQGIYAKVSTGYAEAS